MSIADGSPLGRDRAAAGAGMAPTHGVLSADGVLDVSDRLLGEVGRRQHRFAWLRDPNGRWLPVDSYYPRRRLLLVYGEPPAGADAMRELAASRGLRLLRIVPSALPRDPARTEQALRDLLGEAAAPPPPPQPRATAAPADPGPSALDTAWSRVAGSLALAASPRSSPPPMRQPRPLQAEAVQRATRHIATMGPSRAARPAAPARALRSPPAPNVGSPRAVARRPEAGRPGAPLGLDVVTAQLVLALGVAVVAELYFGVARLAALGGHWALAFGLSLDVSARILGTVAAHRVGARLAGWGCALLGSPAVAAFALFSGEEPVAVEPAPLAGIVSLMAMAAVALALVGRALGI